MENSVTPQTEVQTKFCKFCGSKIASDAVLCPHCGRQVEELHHTEQQPNIVINNANSNQNTNVNVVGGKGHRMVKKWPAFFLCLLFGFIGAHKFYEGRTGLGILYLLTLGLFGIGWALDTLIILFKSNPYYI